MKFFTKPTKLAGASDEKISQSDLFPCHACLCCMKMKDPKRIVTPFTRLLWRAFSMLMHPHENPYTKRAGVAGLRARALA